MPTSDILHVKKRKDKPKENVEKTENLGNGLFLFFGGGGLETKIIWCGGISLCIPIPQNILLPTYKLLQYYFEISQWKLTNIILFNKIQRTVEYSYSNQYIVFV